ncbi:MAG: alpha/beta hydrolase [Acidobacteriota bacterium]
MGTNADAAAPLVLLPGFLCDRTVWEPQIAALSEIAECSCPDYGTLDSLEVMADLVLRNAPPRFALAGHSMGGRVALEVYRRAPERVLRLGLFDTACGAREPGIAGEQEAAGRWALHEVARREGMRAMALRWLPPMLHPESRKDADLVESILQMFERGSPAIQEAQVNALLRRPAAEAVVASVRCPTLLLTGEQDTWSPPAVHAAMAAAIPGSTLVVIPECGHMAMLERPAAVTAAMRAWLLSGTVVSTPAQGR